MKEQSLRITELFYSLQGEAKHAGYPTVFIRLTGCPLRCGYCDSEYAFEGGERVTIADLLAKTSAYRAKHVCVTGGEPLAQPQCQYLLKQLCDAGYSVSLETSGAMDIAGLDSRVHIVMDLKTPDSGEVERNLWSNISILKRQDQLKFVICSKRDFDWACFKINELNLLNVVDDVFMSPSHAQIEPAELASWILESTLPVRMQLQMHKLLWGDKPGV